MGKPEYPPGTDLLNWKDKSGKPVYRKKTKMELLDDEPARMRFEKSHDFKVGDEVLLAKPNVTLSFYNHLPENPYTGLKGIITRIKTEPGTGCCISAKFGGNNINLHDPNDELIYYTELGRLLFG